MMVGVFQFLMITPVIVRERVMRAQIVKSQLIIALIILVLMEGPAKIPLLSNFIIFINFIIISFVISHPIPAFFSSQTYTCDCPLGFTGATTPTGIHLSSLIVSCWAQNPNQRPKASEILLQFKNFLLNVVNE